MKIIEEKPLPEVCVNCPEAAEGKKMGVGEDAYCYNCDYALRRWKIVEEDEE